MRWTVDHPTAGKVDVLGFLDKYGSPYQRIDRHTPRLGEYSAAVLAELRYDDVERLVVDRTVDTGDGR